MNETWIEVTITEKGAFISDWTHTMISHWQRGNTRDFARLQRNFITVSGKTHTYHIWTYGLTYDECKSLAIWYHVNKSSGNIRKYRLD